MTNLKSSSFSRPQLGLFILVFGLIGYLIFRALAAPNPNLPGDLNGDNTVNIQDLSIMLSNYGTANSTADINSDGTVNVLDMSILLSHYGQSVSSKPSIPIGLTATPGDGQVTLHWTANPASEGVDVYQVYWTTDSAWGTNNNNLNVTGTSYTVSGLTNGTTYYFRISAHNSAGYSDWGAAISAVPQTSGGGGTGGPGTGFTGPWRDTSYTVPTTFTKVITTARDFQSLVSASGSLVAGDVVHVVGPMSLDGCPNCDTVIRKHLSSPASIYFDSSVIFKGDTNTSVGNSSVYVDASNIYMYGGQVAGGTANEGVRVGPSFSNDTQNVSNIRWWGLKVHDVGGGGVDSFGEKNSAGNYLGSDHLDFDIETWNVGLLPQNDSHCNNGGSCGTGIHSIYIGGGASPAGTVYVNNSKFSVYSHDTSACVGDAQVGESVQNTELWIRAANLSFTDSTHGGWTAARAFTPWTSGSTNTDANITVHDVEGHNLSGPVVANESLFSGPVTIEYGRAVNTLTWSTANSYFGGKPFQVNSHVTYQNIQ